MLYFRFGSILVESEIFRAFFFSSLYSVDDRESLSTFLGVKVHLSFKHRKKKKLQSLHVNWLCFADKSG